MKNCKKSNTPNLPLFQICKGNTILHKLTPARNIPSLQIFLQTSNNKSIEADLFGNKNTQMRDSM